MFMGTGSDVGKSLIVAGLVSQERQGRTLVCRANFEVMSGLVDFLVAECCRDECCGTSDASAA